MIGSGAQSYRTMEVEGMSPLRRVLFVYARLVLSLRQSRQHIERREIEARTTTLLRGHACLEVLLDGLDHEQGGVVAQELGALYTWCMAEIAAINARPDVARLERVITLVVELQQAWEATAAAPAPAARAAVA